MAEQRISMVDVAVVLAFVLLFAYMSKNSSNQPQRHRGRPRSRQPAITASRSEDTKTARVKSEDRSKKKPGSVKTAREKSVNRKQKPKAADNTAVEPPLQSLNRTDSNASRNYGDEVLNQQNQPRFGGQDVRVSSVPPEGITTAPTQQVVFNAPFDMQHEYHIRIRNSGSQSVGWATKTNNSARLGTNPHCGVLGVQQEIMMVVRCEPFDPQTELNTDDRISIVWTNAPDDAQTEFRYEWLQGDGMVRRKNLPIVYNL